ncbi:hypothetical protein H632_c1825p0 [Helicosporidium sp. ATCC 50920]|nr:hypothetical protein H632_c1825p0 [Helicosporidium sp. ATCC 50920]|eukprot:KDD73802.1 hypothetical protein H632_c1825p0 [Helicosporidium sp. ATCC 50920]
MGASCCKAQRTDATKDDDLDANATNFVKPKWKSSEPLTEEKLKAMREEFWDTEPHYSGARVVWDALRAAAEADLATARLIVSSAGIVVSSPDLTLCYDVKGSKYLLPKYVLSNPVNLARSSASKVAKK